MTVFEVCVAGNGDLPDGFEVLTAHNVAPQWEMAYAQYLVTEFDYERQVREALSPVADTVLLIQRAPAGWYPDDTEAGVWVGPDGRLYEDLPGPGEGREVFGND